MANYPNRKLPTNSAEEAEILNKSLGFIPDLVSWSDFAFWSGSSASMSVAGASERVWVYNEMTKGTSFFTDLVVHNHQYAGWGFNSWYDYPLFGGHKSAAEAALIPTAELIRVPFFKPFITVDPDIASWANPNDWIYTNDTASIVLTKLPLSLSGATMDQIKNHAKILAEASPPLSGPAGWYASQRLLSVDPDLCMDLNDPSVKSDLWPNKRPKKSANQQAERRWLHGDYKDAPYLLTHRLYDVITAKSN